MFYLRKPTVIGRLGPTRSCSDLSILTSKLFSCSPMERPSWMQFSMVSLCMDPPPVMCVPER